MDGRSAVVHPVHVSVVGACLRMQGAPEAPLIEWPLSALTLDETQEGVTHVHFAERPLAMLAVAEQPLVACLRRHAGRVQRQPGAQRRPRFVAGCVVAIAALSGAGYFGIPALSRWAAQRVPLAYERELGGSLQPLLEREYCGSERADAALAELERRLDPGGELAVDLHVMQSDMANAFALPGGSVVLTSALLEEAKSPDEIAGVLAHELEHVRRRHVLSHMIRASLLSAMWSMAVGDYAGLFVIDPTTAFEIANLRHSRAEEAEADHGAALRLDAAGVSRRGLIAFLERVKEHTDLVPAWLSSHPASAERARELALGLRVGGSTRPALSPELFEALQTSCQ